MEQNIQLAQRAEAAHGTLNVHTIAVQGLAGTPAPEQMDESISLQASTAIADICHFLRWDCGMSKEEVQAMLTNAINTYNSGIRATDPDAQIVVIAGAVKH